MRDGPALVSESFEVTGITVNKNSESICNGKLQSEIAAGFDANSADNDNEEEDLDE